MRRNRRKGRRRARLVGAAAIALCASLVAAEGASAKAVEYTASLKLPSGKNGYVDFKLKSKKNKRNGKLRPVAIKKFGLFTVAECTDGGEEEADFYPSLAPWPTQIQVSGRRFSLSDSGGYAVSHGTYKYDIDFSGRIPRHGPPTGTLRYKDSSPRLIAPPYDPGPDPENPAPVPPSTWTQVHCDTGTMSWTGKRLPPGTL